MGLSMNKALRFRRRFRPVGGTIFFEPFTYANGELKTVSANRWNPINVTTGLLGTDVVVSANTGLLPHAAPATNLNYLCFPAVVPTWNHSGGYTLSADVKIPATGVGKPFGESIFKLSLELNEASIFTDVAAYTASVFDQGAAGTPSFAVEISNRTGYDQIVGIAVASNVTFALKVVVAADRSGKVFINGAQVGLDIPSVVLNAQVNFALSLSTGESITDQCVVDNVLLTVP